ncbi:MAG: thiamine diphosphokinase [Clostridia bacterium]|nr:thiamine diphosphokinase [Clostridia bacterium]
MRTLIVLGGEPPSPELLLYYASRADWRIAADAGINAFYKAGIWPDEFVGDGDSADENILAQFKGKQIQSDPIKNYSDGEDAVFHALIKKATNIMILGATGGRVDHLLYNINLLSKCQQRKTYIDAWIIDAQTKLTVLGPGTWAIAMKKGQVFSLWPLTSRCDVTAEGAEYPYEKPLLQTNSYGLSNVAVDEGVVFHIKKGRVVLCINL